MKIYKNLDLKDLDGEIWKEIEGYDGDYFVSNLGRVKSFKRYHGTDVRILEQNEDGHGYLVVGLSKNKKPKTKQIHILMFETYIEEILKGYVIHHKDFTKNDFLENFQMMTDEDHKRLHKSGENNPMFGKHHSEKTLELMRGESHPNSILKEQDVIQIRKLCDEGILTQKEIGEKFGDHQLTISRIKNRKLWKHI